MPKHVSSRHRFQLDLPAPACQQLFTPLGETHWVPGWQPVFVHPADGRTTAGMVFTTGSGDDFTVWTLADWQSVDAHYARYVRTTPAQRTGFVEVWCRPQGPARTEVEVGYTLTALSAPGEAALASFEGEAYVAMIEGWRTMIEAAGAGLVTKVMG